MLLGITAKSILKNILDNVGHDHLGADYPHHVGAIGYYKDSEVWVAFDNRTKNCWVEEFGTEGECINWIQN